MKKKIVYVDMDNTIVDFKSGIEKLSKEDQEKFKDNFDDHPEIFTLMEPIDGAIEALKELNNHFDLYILSTAPWDNPNAWKHKREWIEKYFGKGKENIFYKKVILSHHKNLNRGDILIDDRPNNGAENFKGEWIHFATEDFPNWDSIIKKLISDVNSSKLNNEIIKYLQKYIEKHPDRSYIVDANGKPNWNELGIDPEKTDINKIDKEQFRCIVEDMFIYEDYFE